MIPTHMVGDNISFNPDWLCEAMKYSMDRGVLFGCSVFSVSLLRPLLNAQIISGCPKFAKIAYSQRGNMSLIGECMNLFDNVIVTYDSMDIIPYYPKLQTLWTYTDRSMASYPCHCEINFDGIFPKFAR